MSIANLKERSDAELTRYYVRLRAQKKALEAQHAVEIGKYDRALEGIGNILRQRLDERGARSTSTEFGTPYLSEHTKAEITDVNAFYAFILAKGMPEMLQSRPSISTIQEWNAANPDERVPGVQLMPHDTLQVRAK